MIQRLRRFIGFESARDRRTALLALLALAIVSPNLPMPSPLPAIRLEQIWLGLLLVPMAGHYRRHPDLRRARYLDWAFLALGAAVAMSLVAAPIFVEESSYSLRDPFEIARVIEYWLAFRLAFTVVADTTATRGLFLLVAVSAVFSGLFAAVQYLDIGEFNEVVTDIWAPPHHLNALHDYGRAVGTVGNASYFGILCTLFLFVLLSHVVLRSVPGGGRERIFAGIAVLLATLGIVTGQSRTVVLAVFAALGFALLFVAATRRSQAAYAPAIALFVASAVLSVAYVEVFPPRFGSFHERFDPASLADDPSTTIRVSKWKSLFAGFFRDKPDFCTGKGLDDAVSAGHEAPKRPGGADGEASSRDALRKNDIRAMSRATLDYFCDVGQWPSEPLEAALVPTYIRTIPRDPSTGAPYQAFLDKTGILFGARLEDADDPAGPMFALGTMPNLVLNPSFEKRSDRPSDWTVAGPRDGRPTTYLTRAEAARFGDVAVRTSMTGGGNIYQLVVFDFPLDAKWTASVWARSAGRTATTVELYLVATLSDGRLIDPFASQSIDLPADGSWVQSSLVFTTPSSPRLALLQVTLRAPDNAGTVVTDFDAVTLNPGTFAPSFPWVVDTDPASFRALPGFADSPLFGVGPRKDAAISSFDNEYALFLDRYGAIGTLAYLALLGGALAVSIRAARRREGPVAAVGMAMVAYLVALAVFNLAAGSYYSFQLMAIVWPLLGFLARANCDFRDAP